ncbi:splicing factor, suppressor of white-apricot-like protein [Iris pallida]|uniref:Splicing factor, suppressor of white-apricot-like protein n=1 Tax=Iris pallida TaxID=29817 RepID=A0AAX6EAI8_IRIPA|nr:splicing factor, suppressor of white-apricot-like protein [Iris pallida]KAJ6852787.1 splicing factor, suppressor of white-apricot-like protein [Iris pallida]
MNLDIEGRHALLFDDDANAAFVNSRQALVRWSNDESLLIDRYDVRHLLDRIPPRPSKSRIVEDTGGGGVSRSQLDAERFLDLPPSDDDDVSGAADNNDKGDLASETTQRSDATGFGAYQAVPFSYGNSDISVGSNGSEFGLKHSGFHPSFAVPESLQSNLPPTEKLHRIMARTALFVSEHGGQSEIVLRVKQGDNPTFGFLMPDNQLHAYFRFLVEHPQLLKADTVQEEKKSDARDNEALVATGGALSLLGSVYGFGEEDDTAPQEDSKEMEPSNPKVADISVVPQFDMGESNLKVVLEDRETIKQRVAAAIKEKTLLVKRNHSVNAPSMSKRGDDIISLQGTVGKPQSSQADKTNEKPLPLEPPSFLKRTMDKIVEFILRNGKEFEAVLIEQDKTAGRFPFLSPSNQYHSYYIKVLQDALESKLLSKNSSDVSKKRGQEASTSDYSVNEQPESLSMDPHRKEKFKMVIGGPKKDSNEPPPKPARQVGVSADQAAAIVLAATRGRSPANFHSTSVTESEAGRTSSIGGLSSHQHRLPILGPSVSNGESADVSVATAIAKTVALAAASEADSSDASLTKEQKLKAERLKRAKMFAAMIKSGCKPTTELVQASGTPTGRLESSAVGSAHEEREGSSIPFDAGPSHRERKYRKKHRSRSKDHDEEEEDSEEDNKHSRKKHRSVEYSHHEEGSRHHRRHRHKHHSDSEDEHRHEKSSRHRHRHKKHDSSEDDWKRSDKKRSKHRSHSGRNREREEEDIGKGIDRSETRSEGASDRVEDVGTAEGIDARPSDATTDIPSDLRAKVRAMLLETL